MNLRHLTIFKTVCEEGSITGAAKALSMTQPAISHAINELEESMGVPLFDRVSRKVVINENGRFYLSKVTPLLELYHDLESSKGAIHRQAPLKVGSCATLANYLLAQSAAKFQASHPDIRILVTVDNSKSITRMALNNEIDLGLIEGVVEEEELEKIPFSSYPLAVVCSPVHPFAKPAAWPVTMKQIAGEPLLLREKGCAIRDAFDSAMHLQGLPAVPAWTSNNSGVLVQAVRENLGIGVVPRIFADESIKRGEIVEIDVKDLDIGCMNHVVFHKDKFQTEAFQAFINLLLFE